MDQQKASKISFFLKCEFVKVILFGTMSVVRALVGICDGDGGDVVPKQAFIVIHS